MNYAESQSPTPREVAKLLGDIIRQRRENAGVSQEAFAELSGHHRTYIGAIERGEKTPSVHTMIRVAQALNTTASDLIQEAGF